jgi:hypothetical protein
VARLVSQSPVTPELKGQKAHLDGIADGSVMGAEDAYADWTRLIR